MIKNNLRFCSTFFFVAINFFFGYLRKIVGVKKRNSYFIVHEEAEEEEVLTRSNYRFLIPLF